VQRANYTMSKIIIIGNQKGGVGKSTIATLCANALSQDPFNLKVCIIDTDRQKSIVEARDFDVEDYKGEPPYKILGMDLPSLQKEIYALDKEYDLIFIDTAGRLDINLDIQQQEITKALMYADFLFIPFRAGNFNLDATLEYLKMVIKLSKLRGESERQLRFMGFVNMFRDRSKTNTDLILEIENLKSAGIKFMSTRLRNYTLFEDINTIDSLYDVNSTDKAKLNFTVWLNEFIKTLKDE
jgi:cellulose biosynthesis protein BcsQ